jgi:RNA 3'-terminal phosphate cyclase
MAIAGGGSFRTTTMSLHTTTHIELIRRFLDVNFEVEERVANDHLVTVLS